MKYLSFIYMLHTFFILFLKFIYLFQLEANYFTIFQWFLPYIDMNQPCIHVSPILNPSSPSHPSGSSQCTGPQCPVSCIEPGLAIYFTYDNIYVSMLFSQICCLTYRVIVTIFLNSVYMHQYTILVLFFLTYFALYNRLQFHLPHQN